MSSQAARATPWMASLPASVRAVLPTLGRVVEVDQGAVLLHRDARDSHLLMVEEGEARVMLEANREVRIGPGDVVGETAFLRGTARSHEVVTQAPSRVRRVERLELFTAFAGRPMDLKALMDALEVVHAERRGGGQGNSPAGHAAQLATEALRHRAVRHPYLQALGEGSLPDMRFAIRDFAKQYNGYSAHFPRYLTSVISRLERPAHREALIQNLTEESGVYGEEELAALAQWGVKREWIEGISHPLLFRRFSDALGVQLDEGPESDQVICWREQLLAVLAHGSAAQAVGALGLGTETIVSTMYGYFTQALGRMPELSPRDTVFFPLHTTVDDHHQATLQAIAIDFAATDEGRADLRRGMLKALQLRCAFWDWLHARALDPDLADQAL